MVANWTNIRNDFPILREYTYLDNAATSQKPLSVIQAVENALVHVNANVHRGIYPLSEDATMLYTESKEKVAAFLHASSYKNIVYTYNATESLNMVARMLETKISTGDEIMVSLMEHHSNLIPWMEVAKRKGAKLLFIPVLENGELDMSYIQKHLSQKTKVLSLTHISNVLGTINHLHNILAMTKKYNIYTVIDGAQAVGHIRVDITDLDCDFYCFSGHKMLGLTGIGVMYAKEEILSSFDPIFFGGEMVKYVDTKGIEYNDLPWKFEAGSPNLSGAISLAAAVGYLSTIGEDRIHERNTYLRTLLETEMKKHQYIHIYGEAKEKSSVVSFLIDSVHPHDIASVLGSKKICIRAGTHCAQPLLTRFGCVALARASLHFYNNEDDIYSFIKGIEEVHNLFAHGR